MLATRGSPWKGRLLRPREASVECIFLHPTAPVFACRGPDGEWTALSVKPTGELVQEMALGHEPQSVVALASGELTVASSPQAGVSAFRANDGTWVTIDRATPADAVLLGMRRGSVAYARGSNRSSVEHPFRDSWSRFPSATWASDGARVWPVADGARVCAFALHDAPLHPIDCQAGTLIHAVGRFGLITSGDRLLETTDSGLSWTKVDLPEGMMAPARSHDALCNALGCRVGPYLRIGWGK